MEALVNENPINAYPNPSNNAFTIQFETEQEQVEFMIYDYNGRLVETGHVMSDETIHIGEDYVAGMYLVVAFIDGEHKIIRLVKW